MAPALKGDGGRQNQFPTNSVEHVLCPICPGLDKVYYFFLKKFLFAKSIIARQFMIGSAMKVILKPVGSLLGVLKNHM